jgi:hypothetical protein
MLRLPLFSEDFCLKLAGKPVCINLISFRTTLYLSEEIYIAFSVCMQPEILLFSGLFHSLWLFSGIATIFQLLVTITGLSSPYLCSSFPIFSSDCIAALFPIYLLLRVFSPEGERDRLLIFLTTVLKNVVIMTHR